MNRANFTLIEEITSKEPEYKKTNCFDIFIQNENTESIATVNLLNIKFHVKFA